MRMFLIGVIVGASVGIPVGAAYEYLMRVMGHERR